MSSPTLSPPVPLTDDHAPAPIHTHAHPHAVARLRAARLARSAKPFLARGGPRGERCAGCRLVPSHCLCALRPAVPVRAGFCLLMADIEPLKPSNTGWLIADVVQATSAFGWARTAVDPALLQLLADPQWTPYLVFPGEPAPGRDVLTQVPVVPGKRPLFVLLDGTWTEAHKMFRKSPYLDHLPLLSLQPDAVSQYRLRHASSDAHLCTAEVAAMCLALAGEPHAGETLDAYLGVFTGRYMGARQSVPADPDDAAHRRLRSMVGAG